VLNISCSIWNLGYEIQEKEYYSDEVNFVSITAVCVEISTNEHIPDCYFITVEDMEYERTEKCKFIGETFKIDKENSIILQEVNIEDKLTKGTIFTFVSAPKYFGDGYLCPIVSIEIDGEVLLDFDTGYKNLMDTYKLIS
jgi:hypothetical protein